MTPELQVIPWAWYAVLARRLWPEHAGHEAETFDDPDNLCWGIKCKACGSKKQISYGVWITHPVFLSARGPQP